MVGNWTNRVLLMVVITTLADGSAAAQATHAQGQLTVSATVITSVSIVTGPDGQQRLIIANAADPADNVSHLSFTRLTPGPASPETNKKKNHRQEKPSAGGA